MAKYLLQSSFTAQGAKGLLEEGASSRKKVIEGAVKSLGGKVEALYFAFGEHDTVLIVDLPDQAAATALSLTVSSSGAVRITTTPLITVQEVDAACNQAVKYRPPGG
jgi:uncharacterized protein with GYD domain